MEAVTTFLAGMDELGARPVLIDPERECCPVSSSAIRADPGACWRWLPAPVRGHYRRRVCVLGPESTGKSMLAAALARHFGTRHLPEYGRTYDAWYRRGSDWTADDFVHLARTHVAMREALFLDTGPVLFEDTDALQTVVWSELLGAPVDLAALAPDFVPADLYLLLTPEPGWRDDGTRYFGDDGVRERFFARLLALLDDSGARYVVIDGADWDARTTTAVEAVETTVTKY